MKAMIPISQRVIGERSIRTTPDFGCARGLKFCTLSFVLCTLIVLISSWVLYGLQEPTEHPGTNAKVQSKAQNQILLLPLDHGIILLKSKFSQNRMHRLYDSWMRQLARTRDRDS